MAWLAFLLTACTSWSWVSSCGGGYRRAPFSVLQSAVGFEYQGKTEKHASQKGRKEVQMCRPRGERAVT